MAYNWLENQSDAEVHSCAAVAVASDKEEKTMTQSAGAALGMVFLPAVEWRSSASKGTSRSAATPHLPFWLLSGHLGGDLGGWNTAIVGEAYDSTLPPKVSV